MPTYSQTKLSNDLYEWGRKLQRTRNKLSKNEIEAFHKVQRQAKASGLSDAIIDKYIKDGRRAPFDVVEG